MTLAAYTGPTPPTGYVGYVNLSRVESGVRITVRPESADGSGTAELVIPECAAVALLAEASAALHPPAKAPAGASAALIERLWADARNGVGAADDWSDKERADYWRGQAIKARRNATEAADALATQDARIAELEGALRELINSADNCAWHTNTYMMDGAIKRARQALEGTKP